ncbi:hypothetical protein WJX73_004998 [Symbiochloris irregularis]|uniref:Septin-type G domain-containing protein n=1 Tax=Symbiochloris irregularis TaxID=706552 RepID=A0AAW1NRE6_9CHLO
MAQAASEKAGMVMTPSSEGEDEPWSMISDADCVEGAPEAHSSPGAVHPLGASEDIPAESDLALEAPVPLRDHSVPAPHEQSSAEHDEDSDVESDGSDRSDETDALNSWNSTDQLGQDIRRSLSYTPRLSPQNQERYLKLIVVGDMASGRTTALKTLFSALAPGKQVDFKSVPRSDSLQIFQSDPAAMRTDLTMEGDTTCSVHYSVQETPGLHFPQAETAILSHITGQLSQWLRTEQDPERRTQLSLMRDPRVDACLYFLPPDALKPRDIAFMQELSAMVPVIPILSKADAMTTEEREAFRRSVAAELAQASVECGHSIMHQFQPQELSQAAADSNIPPFAVIGSVTPDFSVGSAWPVREYSWGKVPVLATATSDVLKLRDLVLVHGLDGLKRRTEASYYTYRKQQLDPRSSRQTGSLSSSRSAAVPQGGRSLQAALDSQARNSRLREQVLHDLEAQQRQMHMGDMTQGTCTSRRGHHKWDKFFRVVFQHTMDDLNAAKGVVQRAASKTMTYSLWQHSTSACSSAYTKLDPLARADKAGQWMASAASSIGKRIKAQAQHDLLVWQRLSKSPKWRMLAKRSAETQAKIAAGLNKAARKSQHKMHQLAHRFVKQVSSSATHLSCLL